MIVQGDGLTCLSIHSGITKNYPIKNGRFCLLNWSLQVTAQIIEFRRYRNTCFTDTVERVLSDHLFVHEKRKVVLKDAYPLKRISEGREMSSVIEDYRLGGCSYLNDSL